jgi:phosphoglycerate-specific signal transduction histidine kinase
MIEFLRSLFASDIERAAHLEAANKELQNEIAHRERVEEALRPQARGSS